MAPSVPAARPLVPSYDRDALTLKTFILLLLRQKWLVLCITAAFTVAAAVAAWLLPSEYDAIVMISPLGSESIGGGMGGLSSMASQFSGLASLAGFSVTGDTRKAESIAVLESNAITEKFIRDNDLMPVLYPDLWDAARKKWRSSNPDDIPTLWKAAQYFKKSICSVDIDPKTGLVTLTVTWTDATVAAQWANGLVKLTNEYLRGKALAESEGDIDYLTEKSAKTDEIGVRQTINVLLETELEKAMVAQGTEEYAFKVLDPALAATKPSFPRPKLWMALAFVFGATVSAFVALVRAHWREDS